MELNALKIQSTKQAIILNVLTELLEEFPFNIVIKTTKHTKDKRSTIFFFIQDKILFYFCCFYIK